MPKVLVIATSRKTRGGITSVIKAHEKGIQWKKYHCTWIQTHRDGPTWRKLWYLITAFLQYIFMLPFADIVHIHTGGGASTSRKIVFAKTAKVLHKKIIVHLHLGDEKFLVNENYNKNILYLLSLADRIIFLSPLWKNWACNIIPELENKMEILYNPCPIVERLDIQKKKQILYAGTILKRKGYDILLKAFGRVAQKHTDWKVIFAGNPYLKDGINELEDGKQITKMLNIENQVEWLGWINGKKKDQVFCESSIYCLASESEGFPMGVLDAWAYGVPCIMTPVGGIPDIVRNEIEGLIFPVGNVDALADALDKMMSNEMLRKQVVQNTDKYVSDTFNVKKINKQLEKIYDSLC